MNKIAKPTTIMVEELKKDLITIINTSKLQPFIVEPILQELLNEVRVVKQRQYEIDKAQYKQALMAEDEKDESTPETKSDNDTDGNTES